MPQSKKKAASEVILRRCPTCDAVFAEGTFCETCGETLTPLVPQHAAWTGPPTLPVASPPADVPLAPSSAARRLVDVEDLSVGRAFEVLREVLSIASAFERDGLTWQPQPEDIVIEPDGRVVLEHARAVGRLLGQRFDARRVLAAMREALLPEPLVRAGADVIRLLSGGPRALTTKDALDALDAARRRSLAPLDPGPVAAATDVGLRRERNEDAFQIWRGEHAIAMVVCDGISSSSHGEVAATVGARASREFFARRAPELGADPSGDALRQLVHDAICAAHDAVLREEIEDEGRDPPGSTIVAALVTARRFSVGWVGDSRAYVIGARESALLTRDHSWLNQAADAGNVRIEDIESDPLAHALTRCIGPLEHLEGPHGARPDCVSRDHDGDARLVLCSDGLWTYFAAPDALAEAAQCAGADATPAEVVRVLVDQALARGGQDNVTVAVCALGDAFARGGAAALR